MRRKYIKPLTRSRAHSRMREQSGSKQNTGVCKANSASSHIWLKTKLRIDSEIQYILWVARYTDVTVWYVPRIGGHGSIRFRYNRKKKKIYYARFLFIYFEQTVVQINFFFFSSRCENTNIITCYIGLSRY